MISSKQFVDFLISQQVDFFTGVPDSLLKPFCAYVEQNVQSSQHIISCNEGSAVALAIGNHLATGKTSLVYLQNSGLGNLINPLLSLADDDVYGIPMLVLMGWRGEPGIKDEPQHIKQGRVMISMLEAMELPFTHLLPDFNQAKLQIEKAITHARHNSCPYFLIAAKKTFNPEQALLDYEKPFSLGREQAIQTIVEHFSKIQKELVWISTTGMISRELYEVREKLGHTHQQDFLTVGGMGHASSIALSIANHHPKKTVICLDGDGAALMHLGALSTIATQHSKNYYHFMLNNGAHDSVGGQPTVALQLDWNKLTSALGYPVSYCVQTLNELNENLKLTRNQSGPIFFEIKVNRGNRPDLGRPTTSPQAAKDEFMTYVLSKS